MIILLLGPQHVPAHVTKEATKCRETSESLERLLKVPLWVRDWAILWSQEFLHAHLLPIIIEQCDAPGSYLGQWGKNFARPTPAWLCFSFTPPSSFPHTQYLEFWTLPFWLSLSSHNLLSASHTGVRHLTRSGEHLVRQVLQCSVTNTRTISYILLQDRFFTNSRAKTLGFSQHCKTWV